MTTTEDAPETAPPEAKRRRWCRWTRFVAALSGLWLVFLTAHLLLTGRVWWWALIELMPPVALLLPPLVLAVCAFTVDQGARWRIAVVAVATFAITVPLLGFNFRAITEDAAAGADLKVFAWNTGYWNNQQDDPREFYDYLLEQDADVYLLQEYLAFDDAEDAVVATDDEKALREHFEPEYEVVIDSENVTISRVPIVDHRSLTTDALIDPGDPGAPPPGDPWPEYWTTKILRTDLEVDGEVVSMYNLHLSVPVPSFDTPILNGEFGRNVQGQFQRRMSQFEVLLDDIESNPNPAFAAGDTNSTTLSGGVDALRERLDCPDPDGAFFPASWPESEVSSGLALPMLWRLDWACTSGGMAMTDYRFASAEGMSDHRAQTVELSIH